MKKIFCFILCIILFGQMSAQAEVMKGISTSAKDISAYSQKTVLKYYNPYEISIKNFNSKPILINAKTEIDYKLADGSVIKSQSRRDLYRRTRKRDMGRYYGLALPGALIAGGVTGITFGLGAPLGALIFIGMYCPTDKAVRTNVKISQELYNTYSLPIRLEPDTEYQVRLYIPVNTNVKTVIIKNVGFDNQKMYDIEMPLKGEDL